MSRITNIHELLRYALEMQKNTSLPSNFKYCIKLSQEERSEFYKSLLDYDIEHDYSNNKYYEFSILDMNFIVF